MLFHLFMHSLTDGGLKLQTLAYQDDAFTN